MRLPPFSRLFLHFGGRLAPAFPASCQNALLFFVWLWYIGLGIVKAALKSSIFLFFLEQLCYFNLSPQGDGNILLGSPLHEDTSISTYPRKGTETRVLNLFYEEILYFNLSPQGDGNSASPVAFASAAISTYPRKTLSGAARQLSRRESFSSCHLPCTKLSLSGELARRKP